MKKVIKNMIMIFFLIPVIVYAEEYDYYEKNANIQVTIDESIWKEGSEENKKTLLEKNDNILNYFESNECGILIISETDMKELDPELDRASFNSNIFKGSEREESLNAIEKTLKEKGYKIDGIITIEQDPIIIHAYGTISSSENEYISDVYFVANNGYLYLVEYQGSNKYKCTNNIKETGESLRYYDESKNKKTSNESNSYLEDYNMQYIIIDLLITIFGFMIYPFIRIVLMKKVYTEKEAKRMILWNSIIVGIIFFIIVYITTGPNAASLAPAFFWYYINEEVWVSRFVVLKDEKKNRKSDNDNNENIIFNCDNCGAEVKENDTVCPKCGLEFVEETETGEERIINEEKTQEDDNISVCSNCGSVVTEEDKICPNCNESFEEEIQEDKKETKNKKKSDNINKKYDDLIKLKELKDKKIITKEEFEQEKKKILNK